MGFTLDLLPAFADNYIYLVSDTELGLAMVVDPGDAEVVAEALSKKDLHLALILITHHHSDHTGGMAKLQKLYGAPIIGPAKERHRIEGLARGVEKGDVVTFSDLRGQVMETPGHTAGHVAYYFSALKLLFCGDALFSLGCGRLFEGTAADMWGSLMALRSLPDDTRVCCAHEYTADNGRFAQLVSPDDPALKRRLQEVADLRRRRLPTLPTTLGSEKATNPFLRVDQPAFQAVLAKQGIPVEGTDPAAIFGALRSAKDRFDSRESRDRAPVSANG